jgi:sulfur carrier protein ThiS
MPESIHISMQRPSFQKWLEHRVQEVPDATTIALAIGRSGGVSREGLEKVVRISPETLDELLRALIAAGQVVVVQVNGQRVFRAAM